MKNPFTGIFMAGGPVTELHPKEEVKKVFVALKIPLTKKQKISRLRNKMQKQSRKINRNK